MGATTASTSRSQSEAGHRSLNSTAQGGPSRDAGVLLREQERAFLLPVLRPAALLYALVGFMCMVGPEEPQHAVAAAAVATALVCLACAPLLKSQQALATAVVVVVSTGFAGVLPLLTGRIEHLVGLVVTVLAAAGLLTQLRHSALQFGVVVVSFILGARSWEVGDAQRWAAYLSLTGAVALVVLLRRRANLMTQGRLLEQAEELRAGAERAHQHEVEQSGHLGRAHELSKAALHAKQVFIAHVSHEIRTPLNGLLGLLELFGRDPLTPLQLERIRMMQTSGEALLAVLNDVLDVARIEAGQLTLAVVPLDIGRLAEEVTTNLAPAAHARGVDILVALDVSLPRLAYGDARRIRQVLVNLVSNAIKFTPEGQVTVRVETGERLVDHLEVQLSVQDTGIGLSREHQQNVFRPFAQADESSSRPYGGAGLGLTIARQLVELMGGELALESELGEGSVFSFNVLLETEESVTATGEAASADLLDARVLVLDANPGVRRVIEEYLQAWGTSCTTVASREAAITALSEAAGRDEPATVLLVDVRTLGESWREHCVELASAEEFGHPRLVLLNAGIVTEDAPLESLGAFALLPKPVERKLLLTTVARAHGGPPASPARSPAQDVSATEPARPPAAAEPQALNGLRVLVVEDDTTNAVVIAELLRLLGYASDLSSNGEQACERLAKGAPSRYAAVLMDCQMPTMDGYDATRQIREAEGSSSRRIPIIAVTAHAMPEDRARALAAGMDEYLTKPVGISSLEATLDRLANAEDVIDVSILQPLLALVADSTGFADELIETFAHTLDERLVALLEAAQVGDSETVGREAHGLKGAARQVGATRLGAVCERLEHHPSEAPAHLEHLEDEARLADRHLRLCLRGPSDPS